jgi:hypothetical protein
MRRRTLGTALAVTVTMAAAACGGSDARPDRPDRGDAEEFSVVSALVQLPAATASWPVACCTPSAATAPSSTTTWTSPTRSGRDASSASVPA